MQSHAANLDPEDVLQHLEWVRGLALRLVGDPVEADDLRQEVWLLSQRLQRPRRIPVEGWLRGLLRNILRDRRRTVSTRDYHEQSAALERARSEAEPTLVREASLHQVVVERLMALREPYRSTLLARYFEKLSHAEIAQREGVTVAAVRSRIQRGLGELRQNLSDERRDGHSVLAMLALHSWDRASLLPAAGASFAWMPALLLAGAVAVGTGLLWRLPGSGSPPELKESLEPTAATAQNTPLEPPEPHQASRSQMQTEPLGPGAPAPSVAPPRHVRVEVIDLSGATLADVDVQLMVARPGVGFDPGPTARTDSSGTAELEVGDARGMVGCLAPPGFQISYPNVHEELRSGDTLTVVLAERTTLTGQASDPDGEPLEDVTLHLEFLARLPEPIARILDHSNLAEFKATTDRGGRFRVDLPRCATPMGLVASRIGFNDVLVSGLDMSAAPAPLELVLAPIENPRGCFGRVVTDSGEAIPGAWIGDGERIVRADESGAFQLGPVPDGASLFLGGPGHLPRIIEPADDLRGITLELSGGELTISGSVRRADGTAVSGLEIRPAPLRPAGRYFYPYGGRLAFKDLPVESFGLSTNGPLPGRPLATADGDGRFVLRGLLARDYDLVLVDPKTLQRQQTRRFAAGTVGIELDFPAPPAPLGGVVRTPGGAPVAGVRVRSFAGDVAFLQGPLTRTDQNGRFRFDGLAPGTRVMADTELPWVHVGDVVGDGPGLDLELEPGARVVLSVDLRAAASAGPVPTSLEFRDERGRRVRFIVDDIRFYRHARISLRPGPTGSASPGPLLVPTRARTLVLMGGDTDLRTIPIDLEPGGELRLAE